jgi:hypothetical protein
LFVLAYSIAAIIPSVPLLPNPPGTNIPSTPLKIFFAVNLVIGSDCTHAMLTLAPFSQPASFNASITEAYASCNSIYFPTIAIVTDFLEFLIFFVKFNQWLIFLAEFNFIPKYLYIAL